MKKSIVLIIACAILLSCNNNGNNTKDKSNNSKNSTSTIVGKPKLLSAEDVYNQSIDKVALVISYEGGIPASQGSGFFIDKNTLITNFHCVAGADAIQLKIAGKEDVIKGAKIVKASEEYDLAIIRTKQDFPYLKIDSLGKEKVGSKIYAIGNPRGLEGTISDGILSGKRDNEGVEFLQITAPISPGNSGGPVLNEKGEVIGVSTFTFRNSQNLNFAMPIKYISKCTEYNSSVHSARPRVKLTNSDALTMTYFEKNGSEFQEFLSLKNNTKDDICAVTGVLVYRTMGGEILDYRVFNEDVMIPVGLAKRITLHSFDQNQNWKYYKSEGYDYKQFKVEFRLLSYEIDE